MLRTDSKGEERSCLLVEASRCRHTVTVLALMTVSELPQLFGMAQQRAGVAAVCQGKQIGKHDN